MEARGGRAPDQRVIHPRAGAVPGTGGIPTGIDPADRAASEWWPGKEAQADGALVR
jgi:hypothetical protein